MTCWGGGYTQPPAGKASWTAMIAPKDAPGIACGIEAGRNITCWGYESSANRLNQLLGGPLPTDGPEYTTLSMGDSGSCAIQAVTGRMTCKGQPGHPPGVPTSTAWSSVSVGSNFACALSTSGDLKCWKGSGYYSEIGQLTRMPVNAGPWIAMSAGPQSACGILANDSTLLCWGGAAVPRTVPASTQWTDISVSGITVCGIQRGGTLLCWGDNQAGGLNIPTDVTSWSSVSTGYYHTCGVTAKPAAGEIRCWGCLINGKGRCTVPAGLSLLASNSSTPSQSPSPSPILVRSPVPSPSSSPKPEATTDTGLILSGGSSHSCALQGSKMTCWGQYADQAPAGKSWTAVSAFGSPGATCGIEKGRNITCWGSYSPADLNKNVGGPLPTDGPEYTSLSAGQSGSCAIQAGTGRMICKGQPGYPADVPTSAAWASVSLSSGWGCGLLTSGELKCWKGNATVPEYGQTAVPANAGRWLAVSAGYQHACGILANSTVRCWGWYFGNPLTVPGGPDSTWTSVTTGYLFSCGIQPGGALLCWGENGSVYGTGGAQNVPKDVTSWSAVSAGYWHTCGITAQPVAGQVRCWGCKTNNFGQCTVPLGLSASP